MKPYDSHDQGVFTTGTSISDPQSWLSSILRQLRERKADREAPPAEITATPDQSALNKFVQTPSPWASIVSSVKGIVSDRLHPHRIETTAAPVEVEELWSKDRSGYTGIISVGVHAVVIGVLMLPVAASLKPPPLTETKVVLLTPPPPTTVIHLPKKAEGKSGGGGGGGMKQPRPPSKGIPPRGADKQLTPPVVEIKNFSPDLVVEPTVVAPQLAHLPQFDIRTIGDPNGVVGPPSAGPGSGGGIGTGTGRGVGSGDGPGVGPGSGGGTGGGIFSVGGGVTEPQILFQPQPEYSEDGRKARAQGAVEMLIVVKADGTVEVREVTKKLGYGLDQKAIDAVKKWKFNPGKKDGKPVPVFVSVLVNFSLR